MVIPYYIKFQGPISNRSWPYAKRNGRTGEQRDEQTGPNQYAPSISSIMNFWTEIITCIRMYTECQKKRRKINVNNFIIYGILT